jgi:CheY-like chemotaxis protein
VAKVLIVEDDLDLVETYTDLLEANDHTVVSTGSVASAIQMMTRHKPNVIILDLNLPGDSGVVVINIIRSYPIFRNTKIIVASGFPERLQDDHLEKRVDAILRKPVNNVELLELIGRFYTPVPV